MPAWYIGHDADTPGGGESARGDFGWTPTPSHRRDSDGHWDRRRARHRRCSRRGVTRRTCGRAAPDGFQAALAVACCRGANAHPTAGPPAGVVTGVRRRSSRRRVLRDELGAHLREASWWSVDAGVVRGAESRVDQHGAPRALTPEKRCTQASGWPGSSATALMTFTPEPGLREGAFRAALGTGLSPGSLRWPWSQTGGAKTYLRACPGSPWE